MSEPSATVSSTLPDDYRALFWQEFFASRGRGLSVDAHFPWMLQPRAETAYVTLRDGGHLLAGLTLRVLSAGLWAIGLVCVAPARRGQGLGHQLLQHSLRHLDAQDATASVLWTREPGIYQRLGFKLDDTSRLLSVQGWPGGPHLGLQRSTWPDPKLPASPPRGLPPFARRGLHLESSSGAARLILIEDSLGLQVVEHEGPPDELVAMLRAAAPQQWRMHATSLNDALLLALQDRVQGLRTGTRLTLTATPLQMWRPHPANGPSSPPLAVRLLDRF